MDIILLSHEDYLEEDIVNDANQLAHYNDRGPPKLSVKQDRAVIKSFNCKCTHIINIYYIFIIHFILNAMAYLSLHGIQNVILN